MTCSSSKAARGKQYWGYPRHNADLLVSLVFGVKGTGVKELYLKIGIWLSYHILFILAIDTCMGKKIWIKGEIKNAVGVEDPAVTDLQGGWVGSSPPNDWIYH
jgi:hypothetical protein